MPPIIAHVWLWFVAVTFANAAIWWHRGHSEIARNPDLAPGYRRLIRGFLIYGNIPWLVLGCALELPYLIPSLSFGPLFVIFLCSIPAYWILIGYWLFFRGGAEDLAMHPGILQGSPRDPDFIKREEFLFPNAVFLIVVVAFVAALFVVWLTHLIPPPG
jgi:hypothetical protein